jgi:hypothetical protein
MTNAIETIQTLSYGTELEYTHISRQKAAQAIQSVVGGSIRYEGGAYDTWAVDAPDGRVWKAVADSSLGDRATTAEVVSPILRYEDLDSLQKIIRALRKAGAETPECTSQHVHIGVTNWTPRQIANLARIYYKQEVLIMKAVGTLPARMERYTKPTDREFIDRLEAAKPTTDEELNKAWFGRYNPHPEHYENHRYRGLNLNNIWRTGTVEFRIFNGVKHAGVAKANILLALALAAKALNAKCASTKKPREYSETSAKYDFRVLLIKLGMNGQELKNTRMHLLKNLPGNAAWKNGRPEGR